FAADISLLDYRMLALEDKSDTDNLLCLLDGMVSMGFCDGINQREIARCIDEQRIYLEKYRFSLTGKDLIEVFCLKSGPKVGKMLSTAKNKWLANPEITKRELLEYLWSLNCQGTEANLSTRNKGYDNDL
ncbi:MAG: hypothetical protein U1C33_01115, partial [Candidatus Cloacimonadaceae bacterium]|nr:hypothetical protein [Candidatus Cloacimonadaceae bacterium]